MDAGHRAMKLVNTPLFWVCCLFVVYHSSVKQHIALMWPHEHYHYLPFAYGLFGWLLFTRSGNATKDRLVSIPWAVRSIALAGLVGLTVFGQVLGSVLLGYLALVIACGVVLSLWREKGGSHSLLYLIFPLLVTVRLPLGLDRRLIQMLQSATSQVSSRLLDATGVAHLLTGNVIETVEGTQLFVEEACSGVQSLFTLAFIATAIATLRRHSIPRFATLLVTAAIWAVVMNTMRVFSIAFALTELNIDLTSGWQHDLIGHAAMLIATAMIFSSDIFLDFLLDPMESVSLKYRIRNPLVDSWNWLFSSFLVSSDPAKATGKAPSIKAIVFGILLPCLAATLFNPQSQFLSASDTEPRYSANALDNLASAFVAIDAVAGEKVIGFTETTEEDSSQPLNTKTWDIQNDIGRMVHSIDYPLKDWRDLEDGYLSNGLSLESRRQFQGSLENNGDEWDGMTFCFLQPSGQYLYVCCSMMCADGAPINPKANTGFMAKVRGRVKQATDNQIASFEIKTVHSSLVRLPDDAETRLIAKHFGFRNGLAEVLQHTSAQAKTSTESASE